MKKIPVKEAVGCVLCHDITQIIPGKIKDRAFKKGHIIREEDVPVLLSLGKDNIYIWEKKEGYLHENEAAERLKNLSAGDGLAFSEVKEGKINFIANRDGILKIDKELLMQLNLIDEVMLATRHNNMSVEKGEKVAGTRVIPLVINEKKILEAEKLTKGKKIVSVKPYKKLKVGLIVTGNEVYYGRIKDAFSPVIEKKLSKFGCQIIDKVILSDNPKIITETIENYIDKGADLILCTGGMSVDPDDTTPTAIKNTGGEIISYGAPVLPGAMFLVAYKDDIPILGLPGCVMYAKTTIFDLILPRVIARERVTREELAAYGHGGFCAGCEVCRYPNCSFGKGW
ncbi:molybdopterin-binding protein [Clostridium botulinum]|uniref:molybdopterin-binding protein n=1 Tax=Clostridium botulinum TaxID=1491 RepID=UPI0005861D8D|nr:molybdopterin-binding protein [Clostridium botulinum]AJD26282.1 putative molybdopterin binding domain protein [Clostridium botulinum CDC_297]MBY6891407.1 molybdopterin-binding protein [Clostridium botulinum]MBY6895772.1 molybdopterin-binding protein [Clostridium botulinum]MBY6902844.1 molybdopterin-binding protein [Clostridium botulinum]UOJ21901.1 molybdopterin-binding protein [Clostridium botulinum]